MSAQFNIRRASSRMVSVLQRELDLPRFVAATLVGRGIDTPKAARAFLFPSFKHDWLDPYLIPGSAASSTRSRTLFGRAAASSCSATSTSMAYQRRRCSPVAAGTRGGRSAVHPEALRGRLRYYGGGARSREDLRARFSRDGRLRYRLQGRGEARAGGGGRRRNHRPPRAHGPGSRGACPLPTRRSTPRAQAACSPVRAWR